MVVDTTDGNMHVDNFEDDNAMSSDSKSLKSLDSKPNRMSEADGALYFSEAWISFASKASIEYDDLDKVSGLSSVPENAPALETSQSIELAGPTNLFL